MPDDVSTEELRAELELLRRVWQNDADELVDANERILLLTDALKMASPPIACRCQDPTLGETCDYHEAMQIIEKENV